MITAPSARTSGARHAFGESAEVVPPECAVGPPNLVLNAATQTGP